MRLGAPHFRMRKLPKTVNRSVKPAQTQHCYFRPVACLLIGAGTALGWPKSIFRF